MSRMTRDALRSLCSANGIPVQGKRREDLQRAWDKYNENRDANFKMLEQQARGVKRQCLAPHPVSMPPEEVLLLRRVNGEVQQLRNELRVLMRFVKQRLPGPSCDASVQTEWIPPASIDIADMLPPVDLGSFDIDAYIAEFQADLAK